MTVAGLVLGRRYRLVDRIAVGGMGEVWRATDLVLDRAVAVKLLKPEYVTEETFRTRFRAEARYTAALAHPGIAQVFDYGEQKDGDVTWVYLVMELVPGEPLSQLLTHHKRLTPDATLDLVEQAARGLQAAHDAGIIHRDVKPGNLLITRNGVVKITDFGIARAAEASTLTQTGMVMGTAQYVSPEQASGETISPVSDVYSLGVVAYECLAGTPPFAAETPVAIALKHVREEPPQLPDDVPEPVAELVYQMLAKDPADRPASAAALADRVAEIRASLELTADSPVSSPRGLASAAEAADLRPPTPTDTGEDGTGGGLARHGRLALLATAVVVIGVLGIVAARLLWPSSGRAHLVGGNPTVAPSVPATSSSPSHSPRVTEEVYAPTPPPERPRPAPTVRRTLPTVTAVPTPRPAPTKSEASPTPSGSSSSSTPTDTPSTTGTGG